MGRVLERLLAKSGKTLADVPRNTTLGKLTRRKGVADSAEMDRIVELPRRVWSEDPDLDALVSGLTSWYKTPGGTQTLRPVQAKCLQEAHDFGGLLGILRVGGGKTLCSLLVAEVLDAKRPVLLLPAKLVEKTEREILALRHHWKIPRHIQIFTYDKLGRVSGCDFLEKYRPDLIIADEVHRLKNLKAARTKRVKRYMSAFPETRFIGLSGTITRKSLRDYHHILEWCLPKLMPLPRKWTELRDWADCLDAKVQRRIAPGALSRLCQGEENQSLSGVRRAFGRRLVETPGVVSSAGKGVDCSLILTGRVFDSYNSSTEEAFRILHTKWILPDEWTIGEAAVKWAHAQQLALGFYYRWNPRPPPEWLQARKDWHSYCREILGSNRSEIDSELQLVQAIDRGRYSSDYLSTWRAVRDTFEANVEGVWLDDSVLQMAAQWLEKERGIVWVGLTEFGKRLSELTGCPYFGQQGRDKNGNSIEAATKGPIIASIMSNLEGRNLQDRWDNCLLITALGSGTDMEQLIGRIHREGQESDEVNVEVLLGCKEHYGSLLKAREEARYASETMQEQKLLICDWNVPDLSTIKSKPGPRWDQALNKE